MIGASSLTLTGNETEIDLSNGALVDLLKTTKDSAEGVRLLLTTGTLSFSDADTYRQQLNSTRCFPLWATPSRERTGSFADQR